MDGLSANTRHQLRRSDRAYAVEGALRLERAETPERAHDYLVALRGLHQAAWRERGQPGAFATSFFERFHHALIGRGHPRAEIDLMRVSAGPRTIGFLYNFRYRGESLSYQSGFDYANAGRHAKPGLTCHHQAICDARAWGAEKYDFLAGDDRYKRSLSDNEQTLLWLEVDGFFSPRVMLRRGRDWLRRSSREKSAAPDTGSDGQD